MLASTTESEQEPEIYEARRCFKCKAPVYLKPFELYRGDITVIAFDYDSNSRRHVCIRKLYEYSDKIATSHKFMREQ